MRYKLNKNKKKTLFTARKQEAFPRNIYQCPSKAQRARQKAYEIKKRENLWSCGRAAVCFS